LRNFTLGLGSGVSNVDLPLQKLGSGVLQKDSRNPFTKLTLLAF
jgi:hypothetical protein